MLLAIVADVLYTYSLTLGPHPQKSSLGPPNRLTTGFVDQTLKQLVPWKLWKQKVSESSRTISNTSLTMATRSHLLGILESPGELGNSPFGAQGCLTKLETIDRQILPPH